MKERSHQLSLRAVLGSTQAEKLKSSAAGEVKLFMMLEISCHYSMAKHPWLQDQQDIFLQTSTCLQKVSHAGWKKVVTQDCSITTLHAPAC